MAEPRDLYGLIWYTAYEEYDIVAVYKKKELAEFHCERLKRDMRAQGVEDEDLRVALVISDGSGWVQEAK